MENDKPIPISGTEFEKALFEARVLVFFEVKPHSNRYRQVLLTAEQYKKMTSTIGRNTGLKLSTNLQDIYEMRASDKVYVLPDLKSFEDGKLLT